MILPQNICTPLIFPLKKGENCSLAGRILFFCFQSKCFQRSNVSKECDIMAINKCNVEN